MFKGLRARRDRACWRVWVSDNIDIWASDPDGMDGITREDSHTGAWALRPVHKRMIRTTHHSKNIFLRTVNAGTMVQS